jgi:hypothetical protein
MNNKSENHLARRNKSASFPFEDEMIRISAKLAAPKAQ